MHRVGHLLPPRKRSGEPRCLRGHVAPLLDHGLLDPPGVPPGPATHLLGDVDALLDRLEVRDELGHVLAGALGLEIARLLGNLRWKGKWGMRDFVIVLS